MRLTHKRTVCLCLCLYLCLSVSVSVSVSVYVHPLTFIYREGEAEGEMARPGKDLAGHRFPAHRPQQCLTDVWLFCCVGVRTRTSSACCPTQVVHAFEIPKRNYNKYSCFLEVHLRSKRSSNSARFTSSQRVPASSAPCDHYHPQPRQLYDLKLVNHKKNN